VTPGTNLRTQIPLADAERYAARIVEALKPLCSKIDVAGSIRRRRHLINDIDLVILAADRAAVKARCTQRNPHVVTDGAINFIFLLGGQIQVDVFFAHDGVPDLVQPEPSNWGSLLLCRTGSQAFNVWYAQQSRNAGYHWNPYKGLVVSDRGGPARVAYGSEEAGMFSSLKLAWIPPEQRER
jgi:DNA polymerase/3'-5' exonuclease PolX